MNARIVLLLGKRTGTLDKEEQLYVLATEPGAEPPDCAELLPWRVLVEQARKGSQQGQTQVVVVGTRETWDAWQGQLYEDAAAAGCKGSDAIPIGFLQYDEGIFAPGISDRYWAFFERLRKVLGGEPCGDLDGFRIVENSPLDPFNQSCGYVVVDVTRGWRALPIVASAALAFCRAADRRGHQREPSASTTTNVTPRLVHQIFYAALDAKDRRTNAVPVWDLTRAIEAVELSDALQAFSRHGIADDLAEFFEQAEIACAREIAAPMRRFADDLLLMRIPFLLQCSAPRLQQALAEHLAALQAAFPPVKKDLGEFAEQIERLAPGGTAIDPVSVPGLLALAELAQRLWDTNRRVELFPLLREGLLTAFTVVAVDSEIYQPNVDCTSVFREQQKDLADVATVSIGQQACFKAQRDGVDCWNDWLNHLRSPGNKPPKKGKNIRIKQDSASRQKALEILEQLSRINRQRNDVAHFMVANPREEAELRACLSDSLDQFHKLVQTLDSS